AYPECIVVFQLMPDHYEIRLVDFPDPTLPTSFERFLFNEARHLRNQMQPGDRVITFLLIQNDCIHAQLSVFCFDSNAVSPRRATFGGIELNPILPLQYLDFFIAAILRWLTLNHVSQLIITQYPQGISAIVSESIAAALLKNGFQIALQELNYHLAVLPDTPLEKIMHRGERWKFRKSKQLGFYFRALPEMPVSTLQNFIVEARLRKGHPVTLPDGLLTQLFDLFPDAFQAFGVFDQETLIALAITIKLNKDTLYTFHLADHADYLQYSPTVTLVEGLWRYAQQLNYKIIDLGIGTAQGKRNEGLIRFKKNLGAIESPKNTYIINLTDNTV
ncbi:MAG: hypothetical protein QM669_15115, partial [Siphonobacter sp.]